MIIDPLVYIANFEPRTATGESKGSFSRASDAVAIEPV